LPRVFKFSGAEFIRLVIEVLVYSLASDKKSSLDITILPDSSTFTVLPFSPVIKIICSAPVFSSINFNDTDPSSVYTASN
jgi:hypothetical protein